MHPRVFTLLFVPVALAMMVAGCNKPAPGIVAPAATKAAANVQDADVTTNVKTALLQDVALKGAAIDVVTVKGDVRLIGVLDSQAQIDTALKLTRAADGVHSIHDELTVRK